MKKIKFIVVCIVVLCVGSIYAEDDNAKKLITDTLKGAGIGAISASGSGGKASKGALIGAGANIIGNVLLNTLGNKQKINNVKQEKQSKKIEKVSGVNGNNFNNAEIQQYSKGYAKGYKDGYNDAIIYIRNNNYIIKDGNKIDLP
jgi:hypothetical protein